MGIFRPEGNRRRVAVTVGGRDPAVELTGTSLQSVAASRLRLLLQPSICRTAMAPVSPWGCQSLRAKMRSASRLARIIRS